MMKKTKHLLLTLEKVREDQVLNLVEEDFLRRGKTCHILDASTVTRNVTMLKTLLRNQVTVTKVRTRVSSKAKVRESIILIQKMTMSIKGRDLG